MGAEAATNGCDQHRVTVLGRGSLDVFGVTDVISFDEQTVVLATVCGMMEIVGSSLHVHVLNIEQGCVAMNGKIDSVAYYDTDSSEKNGKSGFFSKLFR